MPGESDRVEMFETLSAMVPQLFEKLLFALEPPPGIVPSNVAPQGDRVSALLNWAGSPTGSGLAAVWEMYDQVVGTVEKARAFMVPHRRNPFFTARGDVLDSVRAKLTSGTSAALTQAIRGMGGIGKTQTAVEYAYRHRQDYTHVLWVVAETVDTLTSGVAEVARVLGLREFAAQDRTVTVAAVQRWLRSHEGWLLVLDNADDIAVVRNFLPVDRGGHVLLTTRLTVLSGMAEGIEIKRMDPDDGALFLLRRSGRLGTDAPLSGAKAKDRDAALALTVEMDGLPLALDQAGAYIEETASTPAAYVDLYRKSRDILLKRGGDVSHTNHVSVAVTVTAALKKVEALKPSVELPQTPSGPAAADLLRLCAFLAPDAIPMEILTKGARQLGDVLGPAMGDELARDAVVAAARRWSLLDRDPDTNTLTVHRIVQDIIQDSMEEEMRVVWSARVVDAVDAAFPVPELDNWPLCEKLLPHAFLCALYIAERSFETAPAAHLLANMGQYLNARADHAGAAQVHGRALTIREKMLGPDHPDTVTCLSDLGETSRALGDYATAEALLTQALALREKTLGPDHLDTGESVNSLGLLHLERGDYASAEPLLRRAMEIAEKTVENKDPRIPISMHNLGVLLYRRGDLAGAEEHYRRALPIVEEAGADSLDVALVLNDLAVVLYHSRDRSEVEPLFLRVLAIREKTLGAMHPQTASALISLATLMREKGDNEEALDFLRRALSIYEGTLGPKHPYTAEGLNALAEHLCSCGDFAGAEPLFRRALTIFEEAVGTEHPDTAATLSSLGMVMRQMGRTAEAEEYERRAAVSKEAHAWRNGLGE